MGKTSNKRMPKILKINRIEKKTLKISVLFSNGEDRLLDFNRILKKEWKSTKADPEYVLLNPDHFVKAKVVNHTLSWDNVALYITGLDMKKIKVPFEVGADTLYDLSTEDEKLKISIGSLFK